MLAKRASRTALLLCLAVFVSLPAWSLPEISWSTYFGTRQNGLFVSDAVVDADGNTYIAGTTTAPNSEFPAQYFPPGGTTPDDDRAFVSKFSPDGALLFSTVVWLAGSTSVEAIAQGPDGVLYVAGTRTVMDEHWGHLVWSSFVILVDPVSGQYLEAWEAWPVDYSEGYPRVNHAIDVAVNAAGRVFVILESYDFGLGGNTWFGIWGGREDRWDLLSPDSFPDRLIAVAAGPGGDVFALGADGVSAFWGQGFVERRRADGSLVYSTKIDKFVPRDLAVSGAGEAYPVGALREDVSTEQSDQALVARLGTAGAIRSVKTFGGSYHDALSAIALRPSGDIFVGGNTQSMDFPLRYPVDSECQSQLGNDPGRCSGDAIVVRLSAGFEILSSTFLGGSRSDAPLAGNPARGVAGIGVDRTGAVSLTGQTFSLDFPLVRPYISEPRNHFVTRIEDPNRTPNCGKAVAALPTIWTPNGRLVPVSVRGVTDPDGDTVTLAVTAIRQDEPRASSEPDAVITGSKAQVRASRDAAGDGRVYHVSFRADDGQGGSCAGKVKVCVALDRAHPVCGDGGALFDSLGGSPASQ